MPTDVMIVSHIQKQSILLYKYNKYLYSVYYFLLIANCQNLY